MTEKRLDRSAHERLAPEVADRLLDLLSSDDGFRERFQSDPAAALREAGHPSSTTEGSGRPEKGQPYYCMTSQVLASKDEFSRSREVLKDYLTRRTDHAVIYYFEAGKIEAILRSR